MALSRVKTWSAGEVLTASDLNAEFNNVLSNAITLISPLTGTLDADGQQIVLDADADTGIDAGTVDDRIDLQLGGTDLFRFNTVASAVNGLDFFASATGTEVYLLPFSSTDSNIDLGLRPKGSGIVRLTSALVFEGATDNAFETTLAVTDPTSDKTVTLPDLTGTVMLTDAIQTVSGTLTVSGNNTHSGNNSFTGTNTVTSTDAGAAVGPTWTLDRNSATPAAADILGGVVFNGRDSGGETDTYAQVQAEIIDTTATSEDGRLSLQTAVAGTLATRAYVAQGLVVGSPTGTDKGTGTVNATGIYLNGTSLVAGGLTTIDSGSLPAATTKTFTSIPATYAYLVLQITGASHDNGSNRKILVRVSTDNGSSYDSTATNYESYQVTSSTLAATTEATLLADQTEANAATTWTSTIYIYGYQGGANMYWFARCIDSASATHKLVNGVYLASTSAINAIQILWSGNGSFDAGTYLLSGAS